MNHNDPKKTMNNNMGEKKQAGQDQHGRPSQDQKHGSTKPGQPGHGQGGSSSRPGDKSDKR